VSTLVSKSIFVDINEDIKKIVEECFPTKEGVHKYSFNMSTGLKKIRDKKNNLLKKLKQGKIGREVYTAYNKMYRKLVT
jgi:hypothetical protein